MVDTNFVPPGFLKLRDAVDQTGRHCLGVAWTGEEILQLRDPPPKRTSHQLESAVSQLHGLLALGRVQAIAIAKNGKQFSVPTTLWHSEDGRDPFNTGFLPAGNLREALQARQERTNWRRILVPENQLQTALAEDMETRVTAARQDTAEGVSTPRSQMSRKAATKQRNEAIQIAAQEIWEAEFKATGKLLRKEGVATRLLAKAEADTILGTHFRDRKSRDGGLLAQDTWLRLISEPDWVRKERSRKR